MANFTVKQSDRLFEARYKEPAFALIKSTSLHQNMFTNLSRHGLVRLNDIRVESGVTNLSDANATYSISTIGAHVRVWLDRLEVFFLDGRAVDAKLMQQVPIAALNALRESLETLEIANYTIALTMHGHVEAIGAVEFIGRHTTNVPNGVGPITGGGVVFYFGPEGDRQSSSLTLDRSLLFSDAVYARAIVTFDGALEPEKAVVLSDDYLSQVFKTIDLSPPHHD